MMKKVNFKSISLMLTFLAFFAFSINGVFSADVINIASNMTNGDIQSAIDTATNGSVINFNESATYDIHNLSINKNLNITGILML